MATTPTRGWHYPNESENPYWASFVTFATAVDSDVNGLYTASAKIPVSIVDAAGDLIVGTAADTVARLPGPTATGQVLVGDTTLGPRMKWAASPTVAGVFFNVKDYGAVGDGTTNNLTAFNNAVLALKANGGGILLIPPGEYAMNGPWILDQVNGVTVKGAGTWSSLDPITTVPCTRLKFTHSTWGVGVVNCQGLHFEDFTVYGPSLAHGIYAEGLRDAVWKNVHVATQLGPSSVGFVFDSSSPNSWEQHFFNTYIGLRAYAHTGIAITGVSGISNVCHCTFINTVVCYGNGVGIDLQVCDNIAFYTTFVYRDAAGTLVGVRFADDDYDVNGIYFYHLEAGPGVQVPAACQGAGAVFGYDVSNSVAPPQHTSLSYTTDGWSGSGGSTHGWYATDGIRPMGAVASRATAQAIPTGVVTTITLPTEEWDPENQMTVGLFTAVRAGLYQILGEIQWVAGAGTYRWGFLWSSTFGQFSQGSATPVAGIHTTTAMASTRVLVAGEQIRVEGLHNAGANLDVPTARLSVTYLGPTVVPAMARPVPQLAARR